MHNCLCINTYLCRSMKHTKPNILVKLILSINSEESVLVLREKVLQTINYAQTYRNIICGLELYGNPVKKIKEFGKMLRDAKCVGLKLVLNGKQINDQMVIHELFNWRFDRISSGSFTSGKWSPLHARFQFLIISVSFA